MKSTITEPAAVPAAPEYPRLMQSDYSGGIFLMESEHIGTCLNESKSGYSLGESDCDLDGVELTSFNGTIELSN